MYFYSVKRKEKGRRMDRQGKVTVGQAAWRGICAHPGRIAAMAAEQMLLRLAALLPVAAQALFPGRLPAWPGMAASALLYAFLVIPLRFRAGETLRFCSSPRQREPRGGRPYVNWLKTGLIRWGWGLLWGLPLLLCVGYFVYGWSNLPFNTMWMPVLALTLPGAGALLVFFLLLFAYGWWRGMPTEYLPARHLGPGKTAFFRRRVRVMGRKTLLKNAGVNALLTLPALAGFVGVLIPYVKSGLPPSSNMQLIISGALRLLRTPLPAAQARQLLAVFLLLYLPLCVLRKMRCAVIVRRLSREVSDLGDGHAAG